MDEMLSTATEMVEKLNVGTREGFNTRRHLRNAERQAAERGYGDILIVDADAHHYEGDSLADIFKYIEDPVLRHLAMSKPYSGLGKSILFSGAVNQFNAGRILREGRMRDEDPEQGTHLDVTRSRRQRAAIGIDYQVVFPTPFLQLGMHPEPGVEVALAWAYTRWWTEEILPQDPAIKTLVYLPFRSPETCLRMIEHFGDRPGVIGFMATSTRFAAVHDNAYMPIYAALQERDMPLGFHAGVDAQNRMVEGMNRFISMHALTFVVSNLVHTTNLVINGIPERFPGLKIIIIESGLAWIPFLMQRLDNEYLMRTNEAPLLKKRPSEYMASNFYYTTQPMETGDQEALQTTLRMINAGSQLMFASDYPHWDFNLPSTIFDLDFLDHDTKLNILGRTALKVFPRLRADYESDLRDKVGDAGRGGEESAWTGG